MLKRLIIAAVGVVGLVVIGLGIASATIWRADDVLVARTSSSAHILVTRPGVLELAGDPVTARVEVPDGGHVVLAVGRDTDVAGWVGDDAHGEVTGLSGWHTLAVAGDDARPSDGASPSPQATDGQAGGGDAATDEGSAAGEAAGDGQSAAPGAAGGDQGADAPDADAAVPAVPDPAGSDLWVAQAEGDGSAELVWPAQPGRWSLLAVSTGDAAPTLSLAWPRVVTTPWLWPGVVLGGLLALVALALLLRDGLLGRREAAWHPVTTQTIPVVVSGDQPAAPLTRRQIREAEQAARTGSLPRVGTRSAPTPVVGAAGTVPGTGSSGTASSGTGSSGAASAGVPPSGGAPSGVVPSGAGVSDADRPAPVVRVGPPAPAGPAASSSAAAGTSDAAPPAGAATSGAAASDAAASRADGAPAADAAASTPQGAERPARPMSRRALRAAASSLLGALRPDSSAAGSSHSADEGEPAAAASAAPQTPGGGPAARSASAGPDGSAGQESSAPAGQGPSDEPSAPGASSAQDASGGPSTTARGARSVPNASAGRLVADQPGGAVADEPAGAGQDQSPNEPDDDGPLRPRWVPTTSVPTPVVPAGGRGRPSWLRMPFGSGSGGGTAADQPEPPPHEPASSGALPVWLPGSGARHGTTGPDTSAPHTPGAGTSAAAPAGNPPTESAVTGDAPDASAPVEDESAAVARADAWRRAWGLSVAEDTGGAAPEPRGEPEPGAAGTTPDDQDRGREQR